MHAHLLSGHAAFNFIYSCCFFIYPSINLPSLSLSLAFSFSGVLESQAALPSAWTFSVEVVVAVLVVVVEEENMLLLVLLRATSSGCLQRLTAPRGYYLIILSMCFFSLSFLCIPLFFSAVVHFVRPQKASRNGQVLGPFWRRFRIQVGAALPAIDLRFDVLCP